MELVTEVLHYAEHGEMSMQTVTAMAKFGRVLRELTEKWKESYFTLTEKELIQEAACVCIYSSKIY